MSPEGNSKDLIRSVTRIWVLNKFGPFQRGWDWNSTSRGLVLPVRCWTQHAHCENSTSLLGLLLSRSGNAKSSEKLKSQRNSFEISGVGFGSDASNNSSESFFLATLTLYSQEHWLRKSTKQKNNKECSLTDFSFWEITCGHPTIIWWDPQGPVSRRKGCSSLFCGPRGHVHQQWLACWVP